MTKIEIRDIIDKNRKSILKITYQRTENNIHTIHCKVKRLRKTSVLVYSEGFEDDDENYFSVGFRNIVEIKVKS